VTASSIDPASGRPADGSPGVDYLTELARLQAAFLAAVRSVDPEAPVPGVGRWRARNVAEHLSRIHHWAAAQARRKQESALGHGPFDLAELYDRTSAELRDTLAELGPDAVASTLLGTGPASFWWRRQTQETLIHLGDLHAAVAGAWTPTVLDGVVDPRSGLWADGVDEVVRVLEPRQVRLGRTEPLAATVSLHAVDTGGIWTLGAHEAGRVPEQPAATAGAPARELLLMLWRRVPVDDAGVVVQGDRSALDAALAAGVTP
jgi:hypothetical protein